jgi:type VI protein secretion system component VasF
VARDPDTIQREIEQARDALASTLDQLSTKANPKKLVDNAKAGAASTLSSPKVKYPLIGVAALIVLLLIRKLFR